MKYIFHFVLVLYASAIDLPVFANFKDNGHKLFKIKEEVETGSNDDVFGDETASRFQTNSAGVVSSNKLGIKEDKFMKMYSNNLPLNKISLQSNNEDVKKAQAIAKIVLNSRHNKMLINHEGKSTDNDPVQHFLVDQVMNNFVGRRSNKDKDSDSDSPSSSSSREMLDWKEEYKQKWLMKKIESMNSSTPRSNQVNMVAARPWTVPCGDPNQHDMPWGTCTLPIECDPEYRIYRGDYICGRTQFVCCAISANNYDIMQSFEASLEDKSLSTDTEERKRNEGEKRKTNKERDKKRDKNNRQKNREKRKKKMRKNIKKIIKEIRTILNRVYKNGTRVKKKKTKLLKKFVEKLKKQYKKDREGIRDIHEEEMIKIDAGLMLKLNQIKALNLEFMANSTFRDIIVNGTINKLGARMLVQAYPELDAYLPFHDRRSGGGGPTKDYLDYDVEYGFLYY